MMLSPANALTDLFEHAKDSLSPEKLARYAALDEHALCEVTNMALMLSSLGTLYATTKDGGELPNNEGLASIFFSLSSQSELVNALITVSSEAAYLLNKQKENGGV